MAVGVDLVISDEDIKKLEQEMCKEVQGKYKPMFLHLPQIALFVEHGTGPAKGLGENYNKNDMRSARERIGDWTTSRTNIPPDEEATKRAKEEMYHRIMETGTPPHPFIRPAFEEMFKDYGLAYKMFLEGKTMPQVMDKLVEMIIDNLVNGVDGVQHVQDGDWSPFAKDIYVSYDEKDNEPYSPNGYVENNEGATIDMILNEWKQLDEEMSSRHTAALSKYHREYKNHSRMIENNLRRMRRHNSNVKKAGNK